MTFISCHCFCRRRVGFGGEETTDEMGEAHEMQILVPQLPKDQPEGRPKRAPREWFGEAGRCSRCRAYFKDREARFAYFSANCKCVAVA